MSTIDAFIEKHSIRAGQQYQGKVDRDGWECRVYRVTLMKATDDMLGVTFPFYMGMGLKGMPNADDVLDSLASDAVGIESAPYFADWAGEYGYDDDSIKALDTYKQVQEFTKTLRAFLGDDAFNELLWDTERL